MPRLRETYRRASQVPIRSELYPGEETFFRQNPHVAGRAAEDNSVTLNPYSKLTQREQLSVVQNERARVIMRSGNSPGFRLTKDQKKAFRGYGTDQDIRETIVGRIISGDRSAGAFTKEQSEFANRLKSRYFRGGAGRGV